MADTMLVLAPAAVFVIALAMAIDVPRRLKDGLERLRSKRFAPARGA